MTFEVGKWYKQSDGNLVKVARKVPQCEVDIHKELLRQYSSDTPWIEVVDSKGLCGGWRNADTGFLPYFPGESDSALLHPAIAPELTDEVLVHEDLIKAVLMEGANIVRYEGGQWLPLTGSVAARLAWLLTHPEVECKIKVLPRQWWLPLLGGEMLGSPYTSRRFAAEAPEVKHVLCLEIDYSTLAVKAHIEKPY